MTRTAADVEAELEALDEREHFAFVAGDADARQLGAFGFTEEALAKINRNVARINAWRVESEALKAERDHLARAELDAATPPDVRTAALKLRAAYRSTDGWAMGAEDTWEALDTPEAAAWVAVAREAGRG